MQAKAGIYFSLCTDQPLFSNPADFDYCVELLASLPGQPIMAYCLLSHELHLLATPESETLPKQLVHALTGDGQHPLIDAFTQQAVNDTELASILLAIHSRPIAQQQAASLDAHRWSSHPYYAATEAAPGWLAVGRFWQFFSLRQGARAKTYAAWLSDKPKPWIASLTQQAHSKLSASDVITQVLSDHGCKPQHLHQARMRRRRQAMAGLVWAACQQLDLGNKQKVSAYFALTESALDLATQQALRQHSLYLHQLASSFCPRAEQKRAAIAQKTPLTLAHAQPEPTKAAATETPTFSQPPAPTSVSLQAVEQ